MENDYHNLNSPKTIKGRGSSDNPANRFDKLYLEKDPEYDDSQDPSLKTEFYKDKSRRIITTNDSPDVPFTASVNPYQGCEHGCVYCYARPNHEFLGLSSGLDFESKIFVKEEAPRLLREELAKPKWKPQTIVFSGVTDSYQPIERRLQITRKCLKVLLEFRNPVAVITKNRLVTRDIDLFKQMHEYLGALVLVSLTTMDPDLSRKMEPRTSQPADRLHTIEQLSEAGIPVGVLLAPVIPALTDHEIPSLVERAVAAGAQCGGYVVLRLPFAVKELFEQWLIQHFPERKDKVLNRIRAVRKGKLYDSTFGTRMQGEGIFAEQIRGLFQMACKKYGMNRNIPKLSADFFRNPEKKQLTLFE